MDSTAGPSTPVASETLATDETERISMGRGGGESSSCSSVDKDSHTTLEYVAELMEKGLKAMKARDLAEAVECFSLAVENRVAHYGELAPECADAYYRYGCALLYKAQEEAGPLGIVPKREADFLNDSGKDGSIEGANNGQCSADSVISDAKQDGDLSNNEGEPADGASEKDQVEDDDEESEGEDLAEANEDDSDLDLAWKMLDVSRAIVEKCPDDTMQKVDILSALGEVALEREDIETSLSDYRNALSILERLVEPDSRHVAELNFRICLVLEVGSKSEEAIPYCQKAISVCKARLQRLMNEVKSSADSAAAVVVPDTNQKVEEARSCNQSDPSVSDKENEIETLTGLSSELERKLEDLQQLLLHPTSIFSEVLKMVSAKSKGSKKSSCSTALSSSQMSSDNGGDFDSPTADGNGGFKHLGVVGRGVKRTLTSSSSAEPSSMKRPSLDSAQDIGEGSAF